jgi:glycolate oxidase iron-sulfur subunit
VNVLAVDADELVACVSCGLCLPHCPTYRVTGEESASPRGRIAAMRAVQAGPLPLTGEFTRYMDECVQCRACEAVCPSSVPFGRLMEGARMTLVRETRFVPWWQRLGYRVLGRHRLLVVLSRLGAVVQRLRLVPRRLGLPRLPFRAAKLHPTGDDAWLFTGCVMDVWQRPVHAAVLRVLEAAGIGVAVPATGASGCCGALHLHAGLVEQARVQASRVMTAFPGAAPVLVDSAGCGAALKDYGHLLGTPEAEAFAARVHDVHEWLADRLPTLPAPEPGQRFAARVAVQDPCHLRHVQRAHQAVRTVLGPYVADLVEIDDDGLCCGAGGAYAAQHPALAGKIRKQKVAAIAATGATVVASANPGCAMHLGAAGLDVRHPFEVLDEVLSRAGPR